jgi:beta-glucuronidase
MTRNFRLGITLAAAATLAAVLALAWYLGRDGGGKIPAITLRKHAAGGYSLVVDGKPIVVKGVCYMPVPIGQTHDFNFWAEPRIWQTDGRLMRELGVNTVRFYRDGKDPRQVRKVVGGLYRKYGIRSLMGHDLGFWDWPPPNYGLPEFRDKVKAEVLAMVERYKDEPGILAWILGNENNYSFEVMNVQSWTTQELEAIEDPVARTREKAKIYYAFVNELARAVKAADPARPVIMGVGEVKSLDVAAEAAPDVDIIGMIVYRGPGFGNLFNQIKERFDRPVLLIEWGADSLDVVNDKVVEDKQAEFIKLQWRDIARNTAGEKGAGNCLGGTLFEWHDEWWKGNEHIQESWRQHDRTGQFSNAAYYYDYDVPGRLNMNEEWYGIVALEPAPKPTELDRRVPKKAYAVLKELWK